MIDSKRSGSSTKLVWVVGFALTLLTALPGRADSWIGDSLELNVADAEVVVRATLETSQPPTTTRPFELKAILRVKETLKGQIVGQTIDCIIPSEERDLAQWEKNKTELLVCLVNGDRYRPKDHTRPFADAELPDGTTISKPEPTTRPVEWAVRHGWGGQNGIIPLDGTAGSRPPTMDFVFLTKRDDILKLAAQIIRAEAQAKMARNLDGTAISLRVNIPEDSPLNKSLGNTMNVNDLVVPVNELLEAEALQWIKSDSADLREHGTEVLGYFKTDENIAAMKTLLSDKQINWRIEGENKIGEYPVRIAALAVLKAWNIDATAVTRETEPIKKQ